MQILVLPAGKAYSPQCRNLRQLKFRKLKRFYVPTPMYFIELSRRAAQEEILA